MSGMDWITMAAMITVVVLIALGPALWLACIMDGHPLLFGDIKRGKRCLCGLNRWPN